MSTDGESDRDELSAMKVSELRQMCSDRGLLVSGKKDDLISRLLGVEDTEEETAERADPAAENIDDAIDKMLARVRGDETEEKPAPEPKPGADSKPPPVPDDGLPPGWSIEQWNHYGAEWLAQQDAAKPDPEPESEPIEAEILEAEIIEPESQPEPEPEPEPAPEPDEDPEDDPS